jgi:hypothetical protein
MSSSAAAIASSARHFFSVAVSPFAVRLVRARRSS